MGTKSQYNFEEAKLGADFAQEKLKDFKTLIDAGISFVVHSMPGVGASYFLKYLSTADFAFFVHVDMYSLPFLTQHEFYKLLNLELGGKSGNKTDEQLLSEAKKLLLLLSQKADKIVIIFSRFDQLKGEFDWNFLSNIQSLSTVAPGKIVLIFTSVKPLYEIAPDALTGGNLNFYSQDLYFKPYSKDDLKRLLKVEPHPLINSQVLENLIELSGGHNQLLNIFLSSHKQQNLSLDRFVNLQLKELYEYLDYQQKKQVQKIALGKKLDEVDEYLLGVGMVRQSTSEVKKMRLHLGGVKLELFTPLLEDYIKTNMPLKLPAKEAKLFKLLRNTMDKVVSKEDIFNTLWPDGEGTDWALDALIYRLRNSTFMKSHGYIIENHKKVGYTLIQT